MLARRVADRRVATGDVTFTRGECFHLETWVDDGAGAEAMLGYRPWLAARNYEGAMRGLMGKSAINEEKAKAKSSEAVKKTGKMWKGGKTMKEVDEAMTSRMEAIRAKIKKQKAAKAGPFPW